MKVILQRKFGLAICLVLMLSLALPGVVLAAQAPWYPHGTAKVDGVAVADGTAITAWSENLSSHVQEQVGATTTTSTPVPGFYAMVVNLDPETHSTTVFFKIGTEWANETGTWTFFGGPEINLTVGEVPPEPDISVSPVLKSFGDVEVGSSSPAQTFTVSNVGGADLLVGTITLTGTNADQFAIQNDNVSGQTIAPAGSRTLQVVFSPTSVGAKSAALSIPSNDPDEPTVAVPLSGVGVVPEPDISVSPTSKNFGDVLVGSSSPAQTFTVSNLGGADLEVGTITLTGTNADQFAIQNDDASGETIAPDGSRTLQVVFSPTSAGAKLAALSIPSNDPDEDPLTVPLTGVGVVPEPDISVSPAWKNFGDVLVGSSSPPQTFTVSNVGTLDLVVGTITLTGTNADQFFKQNDNVSGQTIAPGGSRTLQVVFSPTSVGAKSAALNIPSNDPDEDPLTVPLTGVGVVPEPDISVSPTWKNFGNILVGSSSSAQTFTVSNVGTAELDVYTITITGVNADQFSKQNDNASGQTIDPDGSRTLQVVFSPTSVGAKSAALSIPSNDPDEDPLTVPLSGSGVPCKAEFSGSPRTGLAPLSVSFTDESAGAIDTWLWEFGDGRTSDEQSPVHTYVAPGYYDVRLTASAPGGSCSETKLHYIAVVMEEPGVGAPIFSVSNLYISPEQAQPNQQVEISVNIGNIGGATGTYSAALYINGQLENSETVSVGAGSTHEVVFTVTRAEAGTYEVSFAGLQGQFSVVSTSVLGTGLGTGGIVAIIVVAIVLIAAVVYLLRRRT